MLLFFVMWPMLGGFFSYFIGKYNKEKRDYFADFVVIIEFVLFFLLCVFTFRGETITFHWEDLCERGLFLHLDGFRIIYGIITTFMWMMTTIFSKEYFTKYRNRNRYYLFTLLTLGATMGVFLSADLFSVYLFFEMMSFTSYVWVAHDERKKSLKAAETYLAVAIIGGLVMLMGLFLLYDTVGTLDMDLLFKKCREIFIHTNDHSVLPLQRRIYAAGGLLLIGFGAKAGMFPLHIWLPKAHPVAPAPASALLSGVLTKTGIFGIIVISVNLFFENDKWGMLILILGVITMFVGAMIGLCSIDLKHILACSSMSQIGFILIGIGMQGLLGEENALAVRGSLLHMVNHSLIKLVLFMGAGIIYMNIHELNLNAIRGYGRKKPLLKFIFLMGSLGIGGIPFWNGYVSKTLLHESILEYINILEEAGRPHIYMKGIEWIFLISGGLTIAYMLKIFIAVFVEKNLLKQWEMDNINKKYMNGQTKFAVLIPAGCIFLLGMTPNQTMDFLGDLGQEFFHSGSINHKVQYFSLENLIGAMISVGIGIVVYLWIVRKFLMKKDANGNKIYINIWPRWMDLEKVIYRPIIEYFLPFVMTIFSRALEQLADGIILLLRRTIYCNVKPKRAYIGTKFTYIVGNVYGKTVKIFQKLLKKEKVKKKNYILYLAEEKSILENAIHIIGRSLAFGLLLFCIGLCLTLLYLVLNGII